MDISTQLIEALDAISAKLGIAIDWTAANVLPELQKLAGKIVTYELATSIVWIAFAAALFTVAVFAARASIKEYRKDPKYNSDNPLFIVFIPFLTFCIVVAGISITMCQLMDIAGCITLPEKIVLDYIILYL